MKVQLALIAAIVVGDAAHAQQAGATCALYRVRPDGMDVAVEVDGGALLRGSLVERVGDCPGGARVRVVSSHPWYRTPDAPVSAGQEVCAPVDVLGEPGDARWIVTAGPPDRHPGASGAGAPGPHVGRLLDPVAPEGACGEPLTFGARVLPRDALTALVPVDADRLDDVVAVQRRYMRHFGYIGLDRVGITDWGYVSVPFPRFLTRAERARVQERERMVTEEQREKATSALGPAIGSEPVYTHFLGADVRLTDFWGQPGTVGALIDLAAGWYAHCTDTLAADPAMRATPRTCTLQVGDLAWYGPRRPDPLGHHDHWQGTCVDLRLFRTDGSRYEAFWNAPDDRAGFDHAYNGPLTGAFVAYALENAPVDTLLFNDPAVHGRFDAVRPVVGHDDHIHVCLDGV